MGNYTLKEILLEVENVNLSYGDKQILSDVSFKIRNISRPDLNQGQIISLIGRSGVGKTQLFKIISGLIKPDTGTVKIGVDQKFVQGGDVGIVPQNYILFNHRTVYQNLKIGAKHNILLPEKEHKQIIEDYAAQFELKDHLKKYPLQLSGGQRQRTSILQQVLTGNKFILFDEPFSGLDALMVDKVIALLVKVSLLDELNTLVIVSHDVENAMAISDTVFIMARTPGKAGATITETIDLAEIGMAWHPQIKENSEFQKLVSSIKHKI